MATKALLADLLTPGVLPGLPPTVAESAGGVVIADRVREGEAADLLVLAGAAIDSLADGGHVLAGSVRPLFVSEVVLATREDGSAEPDLSTPEALRAVLRGAASVGYSTGPSGDGLLGLIEQWGLTEELSPKLVKAEPGHPVAALLADGVVEVGVQQGSEFAGVRGVRVVGPLPAECRIVTVFTGAITATCQQPEAATAALTALASAAAVPTVRSHGLEPA